MGIVAKQSVRLTWPQSQGVPGAGVYNIYRDWSAAPENDSPIAAWPAGHGKRGWGRGRWGAGSWGRSAAALGWGLGGWGLGGWGVGGRSLSMIADLVPDGVHRWEIAAFDEAGNESAGNPAATLAVAGDPAPPRGVEAAEYDSESNVLSVAFTRSEDDEAVAGSQ